MISLETTQMQRSLLHFTREENKCQKIACPNLSRQYNSDITAQTVGCNSPIPVNIYKHIYIIVIYDVFIKLNWHTRPLLGSMGWQWGFSWKRGLYIVSKNYDQLCPSSVRISFTYHYFWVWFIVFRYNASDHIYIQ